MAYHLKGRHVASYISFSVRWDVEQQIDLNKNEEDDDDKQNEGDHSRDQCWHDNGSVFTCWQYVYFMPRLLSSCRTNTEKVAWQHYQWLEPTAGSVNQSPFLLICFILYSECFLEVCTTIQYKTLCQTKSIPEKILKLVICSNLTQIFVVKLVLTPLLHDGFFFSQMKLVC